MSSPIEDTVLGIGCTFIVFFAALFVGAFIFGVGSSVAGVGNDDGAAMVTLAFAVGMVVLWWISVVTDSDGISGIVVFIVGLGLTIGGLFTIFGWLIGVPVIIIGLRMMMESD